MKWNKKIAKKVEKLIDSAPDHCISCGEKFPHLGHTFTGVRGEKPVITGHCCKDKLDVIVAGGIFLHTDKPCSEADYSAAFYSHPYSHHFRRP